MELYPGVKISIGPAIEQGFYYDFEFPDGVSVSEADFPAIEDRMRAHVKAAERFEREDVPVAAARARFAAAQQDYKVELIDDLVRAPRSPARAGTASGPGDSLAVHQWPLHRPLPRPARAHHEDGRGVPAAVGRRRVLAGGLHAHDADPHLRHGVLHEGGP